jgi:hypothetical protein
MEIKEVISNYFEEEKYKVKTPMCKLFEKKGSDKSSWHNYTTLYNCLFSNYIGKGINFFELGLGTNNINIPSNMGKNGVPGASLYAFREYFEDANICGADIDDKILFDDDNIWTFYVDQTNPDVIKNMWDCFDDTKFDIMIDDGLHTFGANKIFFDNSIHMLEDGGIYIIEDILSQDKERFVAEFSNKGLSYFNLIELPMDVSWTEDGRINTIDNCLAVIVK